MNDQNHFDERKMYQGNWTCSECGAEIKELPFEPSGGKGKLFKKEVILQEKK